LKHNGQRDLRKYRNQTQNRMIIGLFILCLTVGLGLIWYYFGRNAAMLGLLCLAGAVGVVLVIVLLLNIIERISKND